jgi:hypothetical protein
MLKMTIVCTQVLKKKSKLTTFFFNFNFLFIVKDSFSRNCDNCRKKITNKIVKKNEFIDCHQESDYWPLKPKIFSTFDDVFIIINNMYRQRTTCTMISYQI